MKAAKLESIKQIDPAYIVNYYEDPRETSRSCSFSTESGEKVKGYRDHSRIFLNGSNSFANVFIYMTVENRTCKLHGLKIDIPPEAVAAKDALLLAAHDFVSKMNARVQQRARS